MDKVSDKEMEPAANVTVSEQGDSQSSPAKTTAGIPVKDQKILWARAAGRCSMPDCRMELTLEKLEKGQLTFGEMCHIVGEKEKAARGKSAMPFEERNGYHNLILLCANHHTHIDGDENKFPIEILHKIKSDHEQWVNESLALIEPKPDEKVYAAVIDMLTTQLNLDQWNWFVNNAARNILPKFFGYSYEVVMERMIAIDWPGTNPELEEAMKNVMKAYVEYVNHFLSGSTIMEHSPHFHVPDVWYKKIYNNPDYHYYSKRNSLWARKSFALLAVYTASLNDYVKAVRAYNNPEYYLLRGKFLIYDDLGTHHGGEPTILKSKLEIALDSLKKINEEIRKFESEDIKDYRFDFTEEQMKTRMDHNKSEVKPEDDKPVSEE